jgi:hypothetical protein
MYSLRKLCGTWPTPEVRKASAPPAVPPTTKEEEEEEEDGVLL